MGEIQNLLYASIVIGFVSFVFIGAIANMSFHYAIPMSDNMASINQTMSNNLNQSATWVDNSTGGVGTVKAEDNAFLWLTSGSLSVLVSIFSLPQMFINLASILFSSLGFGLGDSGVMQYFMIMIGALATLPFLFAVIKGLLKVDL